MFDTETMAELFVKQGHVERAAEIYRRLAAESQDHGARERYEQRLAILAGVQSGGDGAIARTSARADLPGLSVEQRGDAVSIRWRLPPGTRVPALQCLFVRRTPAGIETEPRTMPLDALEGETTLVVPGLHSARVAAGRIDRDRFIPIARLPLPM